jgi:hypothetical protein
MKNLEILLLIKNMHNFIYMGGKKDMNIYRKYLVVGIIILFIGAGFFPGINAFESSNDDDKISYNVLMKRLIHQDNKNNLYTSSEELTQQECQVPPNILWDKKFGDGEDGENGIKSQKTTDGGFILLGGKDSDFWLVKIDENGDESWSNTYGNPSLNEYAMDVKQTSDGGYIIVGYYFFFHEHESGILLVKTSSDGSLEWSKTFGSEYQPCDAFFVDQTSDGGFLIFGNDWAYSGLYIIKTDTYGNLLWEKYVSGTGDFFYSYAGAKTDDGYIITGSALIGYDDFDMFVMKLNSGLDKQWLTVVGGGLFDFGLSVIQADNGKYVVAGLADSTEFGFNYGDAWIVQFHNNGNMEWSRVIEGDTPEILNSIKETKSGFVAVGTTFSSGQDDYDLLVILTDNNGYEYEKWSLGGTSYEEGNYVYVTSQGDYLITGYTVSYGTQGTSDLWLLKIEGYSINLPPDAPEIDGPIHGLINIYYIWSFTATDPDDDNIYFYIDWGDGTILDWDGSYESGEEVNFSHKYEDIGEFAIKAKAKDEFGNEGNFSQHTVQIPRNKPSNSNIHLLNWIFDRFPNIGHLIRYLLDSI